MRISARHRLVALTAMTALAAGTATVLAPAASADVTWTAGNGILTGDLDETISTMSADGSTPPVMRLDRADQPTWSPDGSRMAYVNTRTGRVDVIGHDFKGSVELPVKTTDSILAADPTFWWGGSSVVFTLSGRLRVAASDGTRYQQHLFATADEGCDSQASGSVDGKLVFIRSGSTCSGDTRFGAVWLYDGATRAFKRLVTGKANAPAISPDGTKVAYTVDGKLYTVGVDGTGATRLLADETGYISKPAWSPDGTRLAYQLTTTSGAWQDQVLDLVGGTAKVIYDSSTMTKGDLAWQPLRKNSVARVWGADVNASNIAASRWTWNTVGKSEPGLMNASSAVLVSQDSQSYALTAPALAGKKHGPVLLTSATSVSASVQAELKRVLKPGAPVYLVGGTSILGSSVASKISALGFTPKRLAGTSRYSTSVAVAKSITSAPDYVFIATGTDYHSALAAAAAAGADGTSGKAVVVLNDGNTLTASVKAYLNGLDPRDTYMIPVGGSAKYALTHTSFSHWPSSYTYYPIAESTNAGNAAALARFWWGGPANVALASTDSWRGGTSAAAAMNVFGPVLWTDVASLPSETKSYLVKGAAGINGLAVFGGTGSVSASALNSAGAAISASGSQWKYTPYYNGLAPTAASLSSAGPVTGAQPVRTGTASRPVVAPDLSALGTRHQQEH
ncbi:MULTISPECIES: cell wall-binding repeat-containing protein [unclassified Streptomyces]|uniref:cell wall-binding repeat-containing protein n=1 Tax=unclassified Streptomyces TaxID=2593676 RepID=UPI0034155C81